MPLMSWIDYTSSGKQSNNGFALQIIFSVILIGNQVLHRHQQSTNTSDGDGEAVQSGVSICP